MLAGDILRLETPGGGGYGNPIDRPPELVLQDVKRGYYDRKTAEEAYGVLIVENDAADRLRRDDTTTRLSPRSTMRPL